MPASASVTAVIVNFRTPELVAVNLAALCAERSFVPNLSVLVVDGGSGDDSALKIDETISANRWNDWVRLRPLSTNGGFGWANNQAIREVLGQSPAPNFLYLVNPDAAVRPGAVERLVEALESDTRAGAAGSRLLDDAGTVLGSAFRFPSAASEFARGADTGWIDRLFGITPLRVDPPSRARVDWVTGASLMFRPQALKTTGIFDEGFFLYFEEVELMHRMRLAGWEILHEPLSEVVHVGGAATGIGAAGQAPRRLPDYWYRSRLRYFARTSGRLGALLVNLLWLVGKSVWGLRVLSGTAPRGRGTPGEISGVLRAGLWPITHDLVPHGTAIGEEGGPPAWRERR
jgi:N-acetylglucosaminyl-diphospho-decaprenol L-rhamnosyltransferase